MSVADQLAHIIRELEAEILRGEADRYAKLQMNVWRVRLDQIRADLMIEARK